jgi:hypothetical protein
MAKVTATGTKVRSTGKIDFMTKAGQFILNRAQALYSDAQRKKLKPEITEWVLAGGKVEDESAGHIVRRFPAGRTVPQGNKVYAGFELRRVPGAEMIDPDKARELAEKLGIVNKVSHMERVWDYDNFAVLKLQDKLSATEFDSIWVTADDKFALWPLEQDA